MLNRSILSRKFVLSCLSNSSKFQRFISSKLDRVAIYPKTMEGGPKIRPNPFLMKLETPEFKSIFTEELYDLIDLFKKYNYEIRIAGGAVRDLLMNIKPKDIDFATTATPDQMKEMFTKEEIRMINMKGEKHGTITPRINDKENFEITTLRVDILTDGRHAEVQFTTDWQLDANRRDLTINSMFLGTDGSVYDYFYGYDDLQKRRILFVGSARTRIKEDFLRILRYFRFYGRIAENPDNHDPDTIQAISENAIGLDKISGERIWSEVKRILEGNFAHELMIQMIKCGIAKHIGLPENPNVDEFERVYHNTKQFEESFHAITLMAALCNTATDAIKLHERLKLSAFERALLMYLTENRDSTKDVDDIMIYKRMCIEPYLKKGFVEQLLRYHGKKDLYSCLKEWKMPSFKLNGNILKENGCPSGKPIGEVMTKLKMIWANDNFNTTTEDLLNLHMPKILEELNSGKYSKKQRTE